MTRTWTQDDAAVVRRNADGSIFFEDSLDHWDNALVRLSGFHDAALKAWIEAAQERTAAVGARRLSDLPAGAQSSILRHAAVETLGVAHEANIDRECVDGRAGALGHAPTTIYADRIPGTDYAVVGPPGAVLGWLVDIDTLEPPQGETVEYEEDYFEGSGEREGYGEYLNQQGWRLEKAARQVRQVAGLCEYLGAPLGPSSRILDVGAGYGFFRQAADHAGFVHEGIEISAHANDAARALFGFDSFQGDLAAYRAAGDHEPFDVMVMWDVVEHVADPVALLRGSYELLRPGGMLFLRTPNLDAVEHDVFRDWYHSFKAEHLWYFAAPSIIDALEAAGLGVEFLTTESHLLQGFFAHGTAGTARQLRGSDLFVAAQRPGGVPS